MKNRTRDILALDAAEILSSCISANYAAPTLALSEDGTFKNSAVLLRTDAHPWCPLFDQLDLCLSSHMRSIESKDALRMWFLYVDFSSLTNEIEHSKGFLESAYGKALSVLVEQGFSIEDTTGRKWHYAIFDKSASQSRKSIVSFLADVGWGEACEPVRIYDALNERLCLGIDFMQLSKEYPEDISWNKYFAYRALYLTTAQRIDCALTRNNVLVIDASPEGPLKISCDVVKAEGERLAANGKVVARFVKKSADEGGFVASFPFDGEGLVSPELAASIRASLSDGRKNAFRASSFQVRMPFAKGVVHEVDFHAFAEEALGLDRGSRVDLMIKDAYGIPRRWADVQLIITTDMLKCHKWLRDWVDASYGHADGLGRDGGVPDPMEYYFAKFNEFKHALYVTRRKSKGGKSDRIETNYQYLSTLAIAPETFDTFVRDHMQEAFNALASPKTARDFLLRNRSMRRISHAQALDEELIWSLDENEATASDAATEPSSWEYALLQDEAFIFDPFVRMMLADEVSSKIVDCAMGKIPVPGTLRTLSHDLLPFLIMLTDKLAEGARERRGPYQQKRTDLLALSIGEDEAYLPGYDAQLNACGYVAVLRNPHLSRSEQCALKLARPRETDVRTRYFGHLESVCMVSVQGTVPMVLGGADFDGDMVHVFNDDTIASAVLSGAYVQEPDGSMRRRFPIANLDTSDLLVHVEGAPAQSSQHCAIDAHISCEQLLASFQSSVGKLSNSAVRLGSILYGSVPNQAKRDDEIDEDACACYTIATGADIDSIKTGIALDLGNLVIYDGSKRVSKFGVEGYQVNKALSFLDFKSNGIRSLRASSHATWEYEKLETNPETATMKLYMTKSALKEGRPSIVAIDLEGRLEANPMLKGVAVSNLQRLPWILLTEAENMAGRIDRTVLANPNGSPLDMHYADFLDEDETSLTRYMELRALLKAAQRALKTLKAFENRVKMASGSNAFGLARRIAQAYPTDFPKEEIEEILRDAVKRIQAATSDADYPRIVARFEEDGFRRWALCPSPERRDRLSVFLPGIAFDERFYVLLEDDRLPEGSAIPYYLTLSARDAAVRTTVEIIKASRRTSENRASRARHADGERDDFASEANDMYESLLKSMSECLAARTSKEELTRRFAETLKRRMQDILLLQDNPAVILTYLRDEEDCFPSEHYSARALYWKLIDASDVDSFLNRLKGWSDHA